MDPTQNILPEAILDTADADPVAAHPSITDLPDSPVTAAA